MFDRRNKPTLGQKVGSLFWPRSGFRRAGRYVAHRIRRMPGTPYAIAAGFACGAAVSMTPFPGFHFILAGVLAWSLRASIIASAIGTIIGNPWTFPFIWLWIFELGKWILGTQGVLNDQNITMEYLWQHPWQILLPMAVGAVPTALATWLAFFFSIRRMVATYQTHRRHRLEKAAAAYRSRHLPAEAENVE